MTVNVSGDVNEQEYTKGEIISELPSPELREGFAFRGWTTDPNNTTDLFDFTQPLTEDTTLYAIIVIVPPGFSEGAAEHIVQFKYNINSVMPSYVLVNHLCGVIMPQINDVEGYVFDSWYVNSSYTEQANVDVPITADTVFYGKYTPIGDSVVKVFLDCGNGTIDGRSLVVITADKGSTYQSIFDSVEPVCDGHLLDGWYTDKTFASRIVPSAIINEDIYAYANWNPTLDIKIYDGVQLGDLNVSTISSENVYWDGNTIYVRIATVTGDLLSSGMIVRGNGNIITLTSSSTTITSSSITESVTKSMEEIIKKPQSEISNIKLTVGIPDIVEVGADFTLGGDATFRTVETYCAEEFSSESNSLMSGVTYYVNSENGSFYRIAQVYTYQIIQCIDINDLSDPKNPKYSIRYEARMSPVVFELQCSNDAHFKDNDVSVKELDNKDVLSLIDKYFNEGGRDGINTVILYSGLSSKDVRYCYVEDGNSLPEIDTYFDGKNPGQTIIGWSTVPISNSSFSKSTIIDVHDTITEDMNLYAIWVPERLKGTTYTIICNEQELRDISKDMDGNYVMVKDIELKTSWNPIGSTRGAITSFYGKFDGANHTISNLNISGRFYTEYISSMGDNGDNYAFVGMFAILGNGSEISNVIFENVSIKPTITSGWMSAGILAGCTYGSDIHDIVVRSGQVYFSTTSARAIVGGIVGIVEDGTEIRDCIAEKSLSIYGKGNKATAGGIAGSLEGKCTIQYCVNQSYVNCDGIKDYAASGGIAGGMKFSGTKTISHCYNSGVIETHCHGNRDSGSIIGRSWSGNDAHSSIKLCYFLDKVLIEGNKIQVTCSVDGGRNDTVKVKDNITVSNNTIYQLTTWFKGDWNSYTDLRCDPLDKGLFLSWDI